MNSQPKTTALSWLRRAAVVLALVAFAAMANSTAQVNPDLNFRLQNVERRLDQLQMRFEQVQIRVETIDRAQQLQAMNASGQSATTERLLDMQSQHLALAREVALAQQQMLQLQKTVDQLSVRVTDKEKTEKPEEKKPPEKKGPVIKDKNQ